MKNGFTTTILHSDLESPIEHFSVHKRCTRQWHSVIPTRGIWRRCSKARPRLCLWPPGQPHHDRAGSENQQDGGWHRHRLLQHRHGCHCRHFRRLVARGRSRRIELVSVRQYQQSVRHLQYAGLRDQLCRCDRRSKRGRALRPNTRMVFVETIANPRTQVADLARIGELCARHGVLYVVDNTMTSPYLYQPKCNKAA